MRKNVVGPDGIPFLVRLSHVLSVNICYDHFIDVNKFKHLRQTRTWMRYDMGVFLPVIELKKTNKKPKKTVLQHNFALN